jgi:hypothetical protein
MYSNHQPLIAKYGRKNPDNMARVLSFVILTIQNRLFNVPADLAAIEGEADSAEEYSGILYGWKRESIEQIQREKDSLHYQAEEILYLSENTEQAEENLLALFASIHGLGLAKAGFAIQLLYGLSGCLDSHNIERFNIPENHIKSCNYKNAKTYKTRIKYIKRYCEYIRKCGGTESLWNSWCSFVANRPDTVGFKMLGNKTVYRDANHVSEYHCIALGIPVN